MSLPPIADVHWLPLVSLSLLLAGEVQFWGAGSTKVLERWAKRLALHAVATEQDIDEVAYARLAEAMDPDSVEIGKGLPVRKLQEYFEHSLAPGPARLAENYLSSSLFSSTILRWQGRLILLVACLVVSLAGVVLYLLAGSTTVPGPARALVLGALAGVVLGGLALRLAATGMAALASGRTLRTHFEQVLAQPLLAGQHGALYDMERAQGPRTWLPLYERVRERLNENLANYLVQVSNAVPQA